MHKAISSLAKAAMVRRELPFVLGLYIRTRLKAVKVLLKLRRVLAEIVQ
jgi:hypothetical protein